MAFARSSAFVERLRIAAVLDGVRLNGTRLDLRQLEPLNVLLKTGIKRRTNVESVFSNNRSVTRMVGAIVSNRATNRP